LSAAQGQALAQQAHINAGLLNESTAWSINQMCGPDLRAASVGAQHIRLSSAEIVAADRQSSAQNQQNVDIYI
jgi:acetyl-CoA C-acetyltransferase